MNVNKKSGTTCASATTRPPTSSRRTTGPREDPRFETQFDRMPLGAINDLRDDEPAEVIYLAKALRQTRQGVAVDGWESSPVNQDDVNRAREIFQTLKALSINETWLRLRPEGR